MKRISLSSLCNALGYIQQATAISQSQCRKLLDEAAGLSITSSRRIFLARNCVVISRNIGLFVYLLLFFVCLFICFCVFSLLATPTLWLFMLWSHEPEDTPHFQLLYNIHMYYFHHH